MLNDARVASLIFFKDNICTTRINKEKKFKIKFQVLLKFTQILPDYIEVTFLKCQILMFFSVLECKKRKNKSHGKRKNGIIKCKICTEKRLNTSLKDLSLA